MLFISTAESHLMVDVPHQIPHPESISALPFYQSTALKKHTHNDVTRSDLFPLNNVHIFKIFTNIRPKIVHRSTSQVTNATLTILTGYAVQGHMISTAISHFPASPQKKCWTLEALDCNFSLCNLATRLPHFSGAQKKTI